MQCFTEPSMCHHLRPRNGYCFEPIFSESFADKSVYIDINFLFRFLSNTAPLNEVPNEIVNECNTISL